MADTADSTPEIWQSVLARLTSDERITPQLHGFISLVEPRGIMAGTLYLEVPNELTRGMLEQRIRLPLLNAIAGLSEEQEVTNFAIVVNPDIQTDSLEQANTLTEASYIEPTIMPPSVENTVPPGRRSDSRLNPKYNFDNFVIGGSNRFAHAAAVAVAEDVADIVAERPADPGGEEYLDNVQLALTRQHAGRDQQALARHRQAGGFDEDAEKHDHDAVFGEEIHDLVEHRYFRGPRGAALLAMRP